MNHISTLVHVSEEVTIESSIIETKLEAKKQQVVSGSGTKYKYEVSQNQKTI